MNAPVFAPTRAAWDLAVHGPRPGALPPIPSGAIAVRVPERLEPPADVDWLVAVDIHHGIERLGLGERPFPELPPGSPWLVGYCMVGVDEFDATHLVATGIFLDTCPAERSDEGAIVAALVEGLASGRFVARRTGAQLGDVRDLNGSSLAVAACRPWFVVEVAA